MMSKSKELNSFTGRKFLFDAKNIFALLVLEIIQYTNISLWLYNIAIIYITECTASFNEVNNITYIFYIPKTEFLYF